MKIFPLSFLAGAAALALAACAGQAADNPPPTTSENEHPPSASANKDAGAKADPDTTPASETWGNIREYTYEQRAEFLAGLNLMAARLDDGIRRLNAKRAGMTDADAQDWDFAMKELNDARSDLQAKSSAIEKATDSTWDDAKAAVALAWERARNAFVSVEHSTTS
jgi:hypothetical protein